MSGCSRFAADRVPSAELLHDCCRHNNKLADALSNEALDGVGWDGGLKLPNVSSSQVTLLLPAWQVQLGCPSCHKSDSPKTRLPQRNLGFKPEACMVQGTVFPITSTLPPLLRSGSLAASANPALAKAAAKAGGSTKGRKRRRPAVSRWACAQLELLHRLEA